MMSAQLSSSSSTNFKIISIAPVYARICEYLLPNKEEYTDYKLDFGNINKYRVIGPIGSGKYSLVFLGHCKKGYCAIKVLKNVAYDRIQRELYILNRVADCPNVVQVYDVNKDSLTNTISIVTEFIQPENHRILYPKLNLDEIRYYIWVVLHTLDSCHSKGVMHRDIKPGNILIEEKSSDVKIIDWGLSDLYYPGKKYSTRVSTLRYKAPELLFRYGYYNYAIDIWGAGCVLSEMLFCPGFIKGETPEEVVNSLIQLYGKEPFVNLIDKYGMEPPEEMIRLLEKDVKPHWKDEIAFMRPDMKDKQAIDLLMKLLDVDQEDRITARDSLRHPFFVPLFQK